MFIRYWLTIKIFLFDGRWGCIQNSLSCNGEHFGLAVKPLFISNTDRTRTLEYNCSQFNNLKNLFANVIEEIRQYAKIFEIFITGQYKYWITCSRYIRSDRRILRKYCNSMCKYLNLWSLHWLRSDTFNRWFVYFVKNFRDSQTQKFSFTSNYWELCWCKILNYTHWPRLML